MIKSLFILFFAFSTSAFAGECVDKNGTDITNQPEVFQDLIEKSKTCYEAKALAEACAYGSSIDVTTAGLAYLVCEAELNSNKPAKKLTDMLTKMNSLCAQKYDNEQGSMYRSFKAYCSLSAIDWILGIATPNRQEIAPQAASFKAEIIKR